VSPRILGLHHVTATVDGAQDDLDFCLGTLGLRLVKKTVNFDNHHVYHFYYGDERGAPGTLWTTFPYKDKGVPVGRQGAGQIAVTSFSVPSASLDCWAKRLRDRRIDVLDSRPRFGEACLAFRDRSGLLFEVVGADDDARAPWRGALEEGAAIRGLHSVALVVREAGPTRDFMTTTLGYHVVDEMEGRIRMAVGGDGPGHVVDILHDATATPAKNGLGTVHHVAMAIGTDEEQQAVRADLLDRGYQVTEIRDRQYFKSIYFREPGGVLLEIATVGPGFLVDEDLHTLGRDLKLPPWEEPSRSEIETGLASVSYG
jgi:glyoxalase family protein